MKVFVLTAQGEYGEWHEVVGVYSTHELAREAEGQRARPGTHTTITPHTVHETLRYGIDYGAWGT